MARMKKEHLLFLVYTLEKINTKMIGAAKLDDDVYIWCQQQGMDLGTYLEGTYIEEADTTAVVHALEDYCEQIYQMSITEEKEQRQKIADLIHKDLEVAKQEIMMLCADEQG